MELQGFFWKIDPPKSEEKRLPPEPVWLAPDYLPGIEEARAFQMPLMTGEDLAASQRAGEQLICDVEIYPNYFLAAFASMETGKVFYFETETILSDQERDWLLWVLRNFEIVTFNGIRFDFPILTLAVNGLSVSEFNHAAQMIIQQELRPWQIFKAFKVEELEFNHIDLIEVCPLSASLKAYGGRLHVPRMQDLPFPPDTNLSEDQKAIIRYYCINDLSTTAFVNVALDEQIKIRREMSTKYGIDLRSKSDAQIAETVIKREIERLNGFEPRRPELVEGVSYVYNVPPFIQFQTAPMQAALNAIRAARFPVGESGAVLIPEELQGFIFEKNGEKVSAKGIKELKGFGVRFGKGLYRVGIGGLHSSEENTSHVANEFFKIVDRDVTSYYPSIILNQKLHPSHLGYDFLTIYQSLVSRRIAAKQAKNNIESDMLKIVINGSYGKFGSKWSALYAPDLLIQVTLTGQLSLLMLVEMLELAGIEICSANTDGIVMKYPRKMEDVADSVVKKWEALTGFETEDTEYAALYSRDVNNYIAVKPDGKTKTKGAYFNPWGDPKTSLFRFHKNPTNTICIEAAIEYLTKGVPVADTVWNCRDLRKFLTVRTVKGGGVKDGIYLGRVVRWYYGTKTGGEIVYAASGNKVPKSDGAKPCMELPAEFPDDVDFARYEAEAIEILKEIAAI